eukprot:UN31854
MFFDGDINTPIECPNSDGDDQCQDHAWVLDLDRDITNAQTNTFTIYKNDNVSLGSLWVSSNGTTYNKVQNVSWTTDTVVSFTITGWDYRYIAVSSENRWFRITEFDFSRKSYTINGYISGNTVFTNGGANINQVNWNFFTEGSYTTQLT